MSVYNPRGTRKVRTAQANQCDGCGRILPKGSVVTLWTVWLDGMKERLRFCSDCSGVIYGCDRRRRVDVASDVHSHMCREMCGCCDEYPFCGKVEYMRESEPGDLYFGDLPLD